MYVYFIREGEETSVTKTLVNLLLPEIHAVYKENLTFLMLNL